MNREELLKELTTMDFIAVDMGLYLDTHPDDAAAIREYNRVVEAAGLLRRRFESEYGPLTSFRSESGDAQAWDWIDNPWPWQESFNFRYAEEACK